MTYLLALAALAVMAPARPAQAAARLTPIGTFTFPIYVTAPPGDPHRVFVVEEGGIVRIVRDGKVLSKPFMDVSALLSTTAGYGLSSIAFAPDYDQTGHVYALYSAPTDDPPGGMNIVVDEFTRDGSGSAVNPATRRNVITLAYSGTTDHWGDEIAFGPDGYLYLATGEGETDAAKAQDPYAPRGKIYRIDPRSNGGTAYAVPQTNPFVRGGGMREVYAYGLRNPWRFSFDSANRNLLVGDVGDSQREELDLVSIDATTAPNLGWPCFEGSLPHDSPCNPAGPNPIAPAYEYAHSGGRCAIVGGYVVRDKSLPSLFGRYLFGDFCTGAIHSLALGSTTAGDEQDTGLQGPGFQLSSFGEDGCGHLYAVFAGTRTTPTNDGTVSRIDEGTYSPCPIPPGPPSSPGPRRLPRMGLSLTRRRRQNVARTDAVVVRARCSESCRLIAIGYVRGAGSRERMRAAPLDVVSGKSVKLVLRVGRLAAKRIARLNGKGRRAYVHVMVTAYGAGGRRAVRTRWVEAVP